MKVLVLYTNSFAYTPQLKNLEGAPEPGESKRFENCILAFIHVETSDEEKSVLSREKKLANHLKWTARKNNTKRIVLHSFAHLSESKASSGYSKELLDATQVRLENAEFETAQTPFGYFLDLKIDAPGNSLARIWANL